MPVNRAAATPRSVLLLVLASLMWGTVGVAGALLIRLQPTPPLTVGFLRLAFSSPFLLLVGRTARPRGTALQRRDWPLVVGMGAAMAGYQVCYFSGIPLAGVAIVVVVALCSAPVLVAIASVPFFHEPLTLRLLGSLSLAVGGTAWLALSGARPGTGGSFQPLGAFLALGAGAAYASFAMLAKVVSSRGHLDGFRVIATAFTLGAVMLLPFALAEGHLLAIRTPAVWAIAIYMGVVPTGLAYLIYFAALGGASASAAAIVTMFEPAVAALLAWMLLGEQLHPGAVGAIAMLVCAVFLLQRKSITAA